MSTSGASDDDININMPGADPWPGFQQVPSSGYAGGSGTSASTLVGNEDKLEIQRLRDQNDLLTGIVAELTGIINTMVQPPMDDDPDDPEPESPFLGGGTLG